MVEDFYADKIIISVVCHGPAGLLQATDHFIDPTPVTYEFVTGSIAALTDDNKSCSVLVPM